MRVSVGDLRIGPEERRLVDRVLRSNRLSYGPMTRKFEQRFARLHDCDHAVFCNSGTSALHVALQALKEADGWRDGDEVIVPAVTFVATVNIVLHNRMKPVFVDVDRRSYNIDTERMYDAIGPRTRCIIPVHLMGLPADMDPIRETGLRIIEDSCESMFARYRGRFVGSIGDIGCFSTYIAHYIVTGVGGLATTNDPELDIALRSLINHGRDPGYLSIDDDDVGGRKLFDVVERRFRFVTTGHSFRSTELEAAIGLAQLTRYKDIVAARRSNADYLSAGLANLSEHLQLPSVPEDREHAFMLYPIVTVSGEKRELVNFLEASGVETRDLMPLIDQPAHRGLVRARVPSARWLLRRGFYVGCHQYLTRRHLDYVINRIHQYFRRRPRTRRS